MRSLFSPNKIAEIDAKVEQSARMSEFGWSRSIVIGARYFPSVTSLALPHAEFS